MKQWTKRAGYILAILLWLIFVSFPVVAFFLATQGQIEIGGERNSFRLFLLQDEGKQGLGLQWTRPYDAPNQPTAECTQSSLRYFFWSGGDGEDQNIDFCQCLDPQTKQSLPVDACTLP